ncbi:hypothetical protein SMACR_07590 [Sordaria macrospora]|uniref:WGS project CABT00000000 data, contig 2.27 n=2 Tax=Sordaria macrospora TaxID=5147 RepID=F7W4B1_SORMK|nr:uncharacterized protein SMAC_07590 [Sordaria macrospora k-hell]KAA8634926.1 hypothetical protein SMACR_07590 [Sordaria macrospora]WPJ67364.1 hypothetical protein SMAC4_07590 [Sordaria macrospora]CCC14864.1 unnamed protein product [Sordaria macrospora k-hell]
MASADTITMDLNDQSTIATGGDSLPTPLSLKAILSPSSVLNVLVIWLSYRVLLALYNISPFHPLYKFPGPKIAAATFLYEAWYDWILEGQYTNRIREMHRVYGPIIRISPHEIHVSTPSFADEVYPSSSSLRIRDKSQHQLNTGGAGPVSVTGFSTVSHELHRLKRAPLSKFFSRSQMLLLEGEVTDHSRRVINKLLRIGTSTTENKVQDVKEAFNCFTADVIAQYCFGESLGFVDQENGWEPNFATWTSSFMRAAYGMRNNTLMRKSASALPFLARKNLLGEDVRKVMEVMEVLVPDFLRKALGNEAKDGKGGIFADIMRSMSDNGKKKLTDEEMYWLSGEGFNFLLAGTETTAAILTTITFWLLAKPQVYDRLMTDLNTLSPETIKWTDLEQKPYMWAVVHEALRMMPGVSHRSARVARTEDLVFKDRKNGDKEWVIPRGTPVGMTSMIQHWDEELFPQPDDFLPERWLVTEKDGDGKMMVKPDYKLQKNLLAFGKAGHGRACIGESLAYCEVYIMAALMAFHVIPRARLVDTTRENFDYDHDMIVPQTKFGSISCKIAIQ